MITNVRDELIQDERLKLRPYRDTVGKITIGVGRNLDDVGISGEEAMMLLDNDLARAEAGLKAALPWTSQLDEARFAVLVNMSFNLGLRGLLGFKHFLASVEQGDWKMASLNMINSAWAVQVGDRAKRLANRMLTGTWQ